MKSHRITLLDKEKVHQPVILYSSRRLVAPKLRTRSRFASGRVGSSSACSSFTEQGTMRSSNFLWNTAIHPRATLST